MSTKIHALTHVKFHALTHVRLHQSRETWLLKLTSDKRPDGYSLSKYSEALVARGNNSCSTVL